MVLTNGQDSEIRKMKKSNFSKLSSERLINAVKMFILQNKEFKPVTTDSKKLQGAIQAVVERLGISTTIEFENFLKKVVANQVTGNIKGKFGIVTRDIMDIISKKYHIVESTVTSALNQMAPPQNGNGVKILNSAKYPAELKLGSMNSERLYAKEKKNNKWIFEIIGNHT